MMDNKFLYKFDLQKQPMGTWVYAYGLLAGREKNFFDASEMEQLFQAKDEEELLSLIRNKDFNGDTLDQAISNSEAEDLDLIRSAVPDYTLLKLQLLEKDYHNLRVLLRVQLASDERITLKTIQHLLLGPYSIEPEVILESITRQIKSYKDIKDSEIFDHANSSEDLLPALMCKAIKEASQNYFSGYNVAHIDQIVEEHYWSQLFETVKGLNSNWLEDYLRARIDYKNLELLFRTRSLGLDENSFAFSIIDQGTISKQQWLLLYPLSDDALELSLTRLSLDEFKAFAKTYRDLGQAAVFSAIADAKAIEKLREAKYFSAGVERVLTYLFIRNLQRKIVKIARACINNKFSVQRVQDLMRPGY